MLLRSLDESPQYVYHLDKLHLWELLLQSLTKSTRSGKDFTFAGIEKLATKLVPKFCSLDCCHKLVHSGQSRPKIGVVNEGTEVDPINVRNNPCPDGHVNVDA